MEKDYLGLYIKRLNRSSFLLSLLVSMFLFVGLGLLVDLIVRTIFGIQTKDGEPTALLFVFIIAWWIYAIYCTVRRLHDLNMPSWWLAAAFVPFVNLFIGIQLIFVKSSPRASKYGEVPKRTYIMGLGM